MSGKLERINNIKNFIYLFFILMIIWLALTMSFNKVELITGIIICLILSIILFRNYHKIGLPALSLKRLIYLCIYIIVLFREIIIANFDVAYRVIHPKLPIKPGIVVIKTELKNDLAKMILANSITLTPGTFTLDINNDKLLIHWINVKTDNTDEATKLIGERFEKYLKIIFA
jgi:multicomponent Na+:H+ antiporter subunit E